MNEADARPDQPDWLTSDGAERLADRIKAYWLGLGSVVEVRVVPLPRGGFGIASNLQQGLPRTT